MPGAIYTYTAIYLYTEYPLLVHKKNNTGIPSNHLLWDDGQLLASCYYIGQERPVRFASERSVLVMRCP